MENRLEKSVEFAERLAALLNEFDATLVGQKLESGGIVIVATIPSANAVTVCELKE